MKLKYYTRELDGIKKKNIEKNSNEIQENS